MGSHQCQVASFSISSSNAEIQKNGIALINALFLKADIPKRKVSLITVQCICFTCHMKKKKINIIMVNVTM